MLKFCDDHKDEWHVSKSELLKHSDVRTGTEMTDAIEDQLVSFYRRFEIGKLAELKMKPYTTSPWILCASNMVDKESVFECFEMAPKTFPVQKSGDAAKGAIIHKYLSLGCEGELGEEWVCPRAKSIIVDPEHLNVR